MFCQNNKNCFIYFQKKYNNWNYGCHSINPGRAERQSLENLFSCRHAAKTRRAHGCIHILLKKLKATAEVFSFSFVPAFANRKSQHGKDLCLKLYSADSQCHKWGHKGNALQKTSPYKFQLHLQTWNFWRKDEMFVLATQSIYFSHTCCLPSKEKGVLFFFFYFQMYIFFSQTSNVFIFP